MSSLSLPRIGPATKLKLAKLNINSDSDLLLHLPTRYLDFSQRKNIVDLQVNQSVTLHAKIESIKNIHTKTGKNMQHLVVTDATGRLNIYFFNQSYLLKIFKPNFSYSFAGKVSLFIGKICLISPIFDPAAAGRILPIYSLTSGLSSNFFRTIIPNNWPIIIKSQLQPTLPTALLQSNHLTDLNTSLKLLHQPTSLQLLEQAKSSFIFHELLLLRSQAELISQESKSKSAPSLEINTNYLQKLQSHLSYQLTPSQTLALQEIVLDLKLPHPTHRLLIGDVGSGKTIVAALACLGSVEQKHSSLILAPTKILAQQHFQTLTNLFPKQPIFLHETKNPQKPHLLITTQRAFFHSEAQPDYALVVYDEQHKFGVEQRDYFQNKPNHPHVLTMSATPIPRSVMLSLLGNLPVSRINNRTISTIKSFVVTPNKEIDCLNWLFNHLIQTKEQAYIICPKIEAEGEHSLKKIYQKIKQLAPKDLNIGQIHGQLNKESQDKVAASFYANKTQILLATSIIEVGLDVGNASCILIYDPDDFGLAQLHQLRGRVGRRGPESFCYLISSEEQASERLKYFCRTKDGLKLSLFDLKQRGSGDLFGLVQHGRSQLKLANLTNLNLLTQSAKLWQELQTYPNDLAKWLKYASLKLKDQSSLVLN